MNAKQNVDTALSLLAPGAIVHFSCGATWTVESSTFPGSASVYYRDARGVSALPRWRVREWFLAGRIVRVSAP